MDEPKHIFLADDDDDDRLLFNDALKELPDAVQLSTARDGEHLMKLLHGLTHLPDLLFLDLNMPLKNGFECLVEIRRSEKLRPLPVVIFSTTSQPSAIDEVYQNGAHLFIRKPNDFTSLKKMIQYVLSCDWKANTDQPPKEEFILDLA